jgi:lactam utilization protein B
MNWLEEIIVQVMEDHYFEGGMSYRGLDNVLHIDEEDAAYVEKKAKAIKDRVLKAINEDRELIFAKSPDVRGDMEKTVAIRNKLRTEIKEALGLEE